jgi:hypothetical protein
VLNAGVVPRDGDSDGYADVVRMDVGRTMVSSAGSFSSRREGGRRLEAVMASGDDELLVPLQNKMIPMN